MDTDKLTIFVITHAKNAQQYAPPFVKLYVGFKNGDQLDSLSDATGDSIAAKNFSFCELTGQYWIYKNYRAEYVGLVHYRRFFFHPLKSWRHYNFYTGAELLKILQKKDAIVAETFVPRQKGTLLKNTIWGHYAVNHNIQDLAKTREIVAQLYPSYLASFDKVMKQKSFSPFNMLVTKKSIFDEYSKFLFDILWELEKQIDIAHYDDFQKRVFGFIGERLLNVFFTANKQYKLKRLPVCKMSNKPAATIKERLVNFLKRLLP